MRDRKGRLAGLGGQEGGKNKLNRVFGQQQQREKNPTVSSRPGEGRGHLKEFWGHLGRELSCLPERYFQRKIFK